MLRVVQVVHQQRCNGHCLSDCPAQQLKEQLHSAQVAGQWRGDTVLTLPLFWRRSTVSPVFFGRFPRSSQSPCPLPTLSPSLIGHPASVDVKQHESQRKANQARTSVHWKKGYTVQCISQPSMNTCPLEKRIYSPVHQPTKHEHLSSGKKGFTVQCISQPSMNTCPVEKRIYSPVHQPTRHEHQSSGKKQFTVLRVSQPGMNTSPLQIVNARFLTKILM